MMPYVPIDKAGEPFTGRTASAYRRHGHDWPICLVITKVRIGLFLIKKENGFRIILTLRRIDILHIGHAFEYFSPDAELANMPLLLPMTGAANTGDTSLQVMHDISVTRDFSGALMKDMRHISSAFCKWYYIWCLHPRHEDVLYSWF